MTEGHNLEGSLAIEQFLASAHGSRLARATTALERAVAVNDWLNSHTVASRQDLEDMRTVTSGSAVSADQRSTVDLPPPASPEIALIDALKTRRSRYDYVDRPLAIEALSSLLGHAIGLGRRVSAYGRTDYPLSVAPSGGGLNSVAVYVAVRRVDGLPPGIYAYQPTAHFLTTHTVGDPTERMRDVYLQTEFPTTVAVSLMLVGRLRRVLAKYPLRHYRVLHVDAGIAIQNLYLVSTALGLSCCAITGYRDQSVKDLLRLDEGEIPTVVFAVGYSPSASDARD